MNRNLWVVLITSTAVGCGSAEMRGGGPDGLLDGDEGGAGDFGEGGELGEGGEGGEGGPGGEGFDPDDEVSGIEGGNARPDGDAAAEDLQAEAASFALMVGSADGGVSLRRPEPTADPVPALPGDMRYEPTGFAPVWAEGLAALPLEDGVAVIDATGAVRASWRGDGCGRVQAPPAPMRDRGGFALVEDRTLCGKPPRVLLLSPDDEPSDGVEAPEDLWLIAGAHAPDTALYGRRGEVGRISLDSGERKPALRLSAGERVRAATATPDARSLVVLIETVEAARLVRTDPFGLASTVEHRLAERPQSIRPLLAALPGGAVVLADDDLVRFFAEPKAEPVEKQAAPGELLALAPMPDGERVLATWVGKSAVLGPEAFDALSFEHQPGSRPAVRPDGAVVAFDAPGDETCSAGVTELDLVDPERRRVVSDERCDRALGWLQTGAATAPE